MSRLIIDKNLTFGAVNLNFHYSYNELVSLYPPKLLYTLSRHTNKMVNSTWFKPSCLKLNSFKAWHLSAPYIEILLLNLKILHLDATECNIKTYKHS